MAEEKILVSNILDNLFYSMTEKEFNELETLQDLFYIRCNTICQILRKIDRDYVTMNSFDIWDDEIHCSGCDDDRDTIYLRFPKKFIYSPDSEIEEYANDILKQRYEKRKELERKRQEDIEKKERAEFARLKKKYGE